MQIDLECPREDNHRRSLFCYERVSNSSLLAIVDCSRYNWTGTPQVLYCYSIAFPGFGIGTAAAFGLAKVATIGITVFIKLTESVFKMTMKGSQKLQEWHHRSSTCPLSMAFHICANTIYIALSLTVLTIMVASSCYISLATPLNFSAQSLLQVMIYYSYVAMCPQVLIPLVITIIKLPFHCKQGEYTSLAKEQRPPNPLDWDVESELSVAVELENECATTEQAPTESHSDVASGMTVMMTEGTQHANSISSTASVASTDDETQV